MVTIKISRTGKDEDKCNCIKILLCKEKIKEVLADDDLC